MKYKIGVIGTGFMAAKHCDTLSKCDNSELITICSTEKSLHIAEEFRNKFNFKKTTSDYNSMLLDTDIDIIFICTPDSQHPDQIIQALKAGKHVFCEKPVARSMEDFNRIREALKDSRKVLQVGMNCRFREQYSIPYQVIKDKSLGELALLKGIFTLNSIKSVKNMEKKWWFDYPPEIFPLLHGGAIHCLDLILWIGGKVKSVFARAAAIELLKEWKADTFLISLEFESGIPGELIISVAANRPNELTLEAWLTKGSINGNKIYKLENDYSLKEETITIEQKQLDLRLQYNDMIYSIENEAQPLNSFEEAYKNFIVINAIEISVKEKKIVYLGED
jgi:predicted dehydrogenase